MEEGAKHLCNGTPTQYLVGPLFGRAFQEGEVYGGQHLWYELRCSKCDFVYEYITHSGRCHRGQELTLLGAHWNTKHEQFVFKQGEAPSWHDWDLTEVQREEISSYYRGYLEKVPDLLGISRVTSF